MRISGSIIEDMPKKEAFFQDIIFFEKEFDGVMPLEIMIDTKRKKGVMKLSTLKRMEELEEAIAKGDRKAVVSIERKVKRSYREMEKQGLIVPYGMEWFYSMVPYELWSQNTSE
jgi:predicted RND superfamily exporter protein